MKIRYGGPDDCAVEAPEGSHPSIDHGMFGPPAATVVIDHGALSESPSKQLGMLVGSLGADRSSTIRASGSAGDAMEVSTVAGVDAPNRGAMRPERAGKAVPPP